MNAPILFNRYRLVDARTARGLTQTQLAEITGIKKQSISYYENGKQIPRPENVLNLADKLGVTLSFLQKESFPCSEKTIFFRSHRGLSAKEWKKAEVKLHWFEELLSYFEEYVDLVPENIPAKFDVSDRLGKVTAEEIEEIAVSLREYWGLGLGPISNITRLMENNGAIVIRVPFDVKEEDAFSQWLNASTTPVVVMVAENPSACRDRFSLAHELGHIVLHRNVSQSRDNIGLVEEQANMFASAFLLPAGSYPREFRYPTLEIYKMLKERWKVSIKAQIFRSKALHIISEDTARNFYMNMAKRKWLKKEPLDDFIEFEEPKIIKDIVKLLFEQLDIDVSDIAGATSLAVHDVIQLCNLDSHEDIEKNNAPLLRRNKSNVLSFCSAK
jgi:Zn-dependent peptidase ImmA (M78 family)/DNA-binding XRE family transcriptional regulator